jgi:hypothetical protein
VHLDPLRFPRPFSSRGFRKRGAARLHNLHLNIIAFASASESAENFVTISGKAAGTTSGPRHSKDVNRVLAIDWPRMLRRNVLPPSRHTVSQPDCTIGSSGLHTGSQQPSGLDFHLNDINHLVNTLGAPGQSSPGHHLILAANRIRYLSPISMLRSATRTDVRPRHMLSRPARPARFRAADPPAAIDLVRSIPL